MAKRDKPKRSTQDVLQEVLGKKKRNKQAKSLAKQADNQTDKKTKGNVAQVPVIIEEAQGVKIGLEEYGNKSNNLKEELNAMEVKVLEFYLSGRFGIDSSMVAAGYGEYSKSERLRKFHTIRRKYERRADYREILRSCGVGELKVAEKIKQLMDAESERTQLGATKLAAECHQMVGSRQDQGGGGGVQINILCTDSKLEANHPAAPGKLTFSFPAPDE